MISVELTEVEYNFLQALISDAGELVPDDYYKDFIELIENDGEEFDGTFYGVPIDEPTDENYDTNRDILYGVVGSLLQKFN